MRKLISAVFLALMALIQVHAQDSDLRSAPDLPTFKVTLNYSASEGGTITSDISSGAKVAYNTAHKFTITANAGYVLADITMNTATIGTLPTGTFNGDNTTTYTYTSPALAKATEIKATFKAKDPVTVTMSPASATLDEVKAKVNLPKLAFTPEDVTGYTVKYKNVATGTETTDLPVTVGKYNVLITKAETATQAAIAKKFDYEILPAHTLTYTFEATQGTVAATMNGTAVTSGGEIAYDKPAVLKITAKSGYVLGKLTVDNQVVNLPEGTFDATTKVTTYAAYTTANLKTAMSINVEFTAKKTVSVSANPLSATRDEIAADKNLPTVTFTPSISGQKYQFKNASGTLMDKLPATDGVYTIVATSPETADYAALTDESNKFTISQANKLSWSVEGEQGTVTAKMGDKDVVNGGDIVNGKTAVLTITAKPGYKLSEIKIDGKPANLPTGKFNSTDNTISYTTGELTASATINVVFTEKMKVTAKVTGSSATKDQVVAKQNLPVIKFTPEMNGQAVTYRAVNSKETKDLPAEVGVYKIVLISPETMEYAALTDSSNTFTVTGANALVYAVGEHGTVTAKMDGKDVVSGGDIAYGKAAVFSIVSNSNYKLGAIKQGSSDVDISKIAGTYADGKTSYTYTTSELTAGAGYTFVFISKDTVKFVANNLTQMEGSIKQVTVASDIKDIEIEYQVNGTNWIKELPSTLKAGSYKARFTRPEDLTYRSLSDTATLVVESKKEVSISKLPDAGYIEEGEPLSIAVLQGGSVEGTTGSFVWTNPNDTVSLTKTKYSITFMPDDPILYLAKDTFINVKVTPVYTMKVTAANFGTVKLTGRSANDRYAEGYELAAEAIADKNYTFAGWSDGNTSAIRTLTATKDLELVARFDSILHKVNIGTPANGTLEVYANGVEVKDGEALLQGTLLTINATPTDKKHMMVKSVKVNGALVNTGSYTLAQAATIEASFEEKPAATHLVNVSNSGHGSVTLLDNKSKAPITPGAAIAEGVIVKVICKADYGYALNSVNVENAADSSTDNTFTVGTADANVKVNFGLTQFKVTAAANIPTAGSVSLTKVEDNATVTSGSDVNYQTRLVATVTTNSGYRFKSMTANSSEIKDGDTLVVSGPMTIAANYIGKTKLEINTAQQSLVYNKQPRSYEVKVKGGHAAKGFQVTYSKNGVSLGETLPQDAGTYTVNITRPEDDLYKAVSETATLVINKAGMALKSVPTLNGNDVTAELTQDIADIAWNPGSVSTLSKLRAAATGTPTNNEVNVIRFTPKDKNNYEPVDYYIAVGEVEPVTLTTKDTYVTNGGLEVTSTEIAKGTKLTLKAIAPEGQRFVKWKEDNDTNIEREVTMNADATYTPVFEALKTLSIKNRLIEKSYDGAIQVVSLSELFNETGLPENEIVLKYANVDGSSATPMNAGTYMVNVSFAGNDEWKEFYDVNIKLVIKPATINSFTTLTASELTEGQPLSASILSGGVASTASTNGTTVAGIFEWAEPNKIPGVGDDQSYKVEFTSYDPNYSNNETNAKVTVKSTGASVITFEQPENGTLKVYTVDESGEQTEINSGTAVAPGSKLIVEVEPAKGYELENLQIGEKSYTSNSAQIDNVEGSLAIIATMKESTPDTPVVPDVRVTGVKLNVTSKSIAVGESFVLKATVSPSNATMQSVSWSSSDETVATVDADGIVTALKVGSCKITVATDDGNKTATCDVSVSTTVSIEQIAEGIRVYGIHGAVMVEPTAPVSIRIFAVTGNCLYSGNVSDITRIPAPAGIYLIELSANGRHAATKVSVR